MKIIMYTMEKKARFDSADPKGLLLRRIKLSNQNFSTNFIKWVTHL